MDQPITWPDGKRFAFTVFDDADKDYLHNTRPVYDFLADHNIHTTKSVWLLEGEFEHPLGGDSCQNPDYLAWAKRVQEKGFEIAWHNARYHSSPREITERALLLFRDYFGHFPRSMSNHFENEEAIYWGDARLRGLTRLLYRCAQSRGEKRSYEGHVGDSKFFWGDLCHEHIEYVRNFVYREIDTLKACPCMPYHDPTMPYVRSWYASSEAGNLEAFNAMLTEKNQEKLIESGGACIIYTHFGKDFWRDGELDRRFVELIKRLAGSGGWFVPVSTLLDHLKSQHGGVHQITPWQREKLQRRWITSKLIHGSS